ncbi:MAG: flagellar biosynthesis protein FlgD [Rhodospirillales bacterium]|jgi:flagellar basal-body rod modification protein FlgD|nr:flagellar biosynthesis protein FlgD [Rhodospirillales bacterium]
MTANLAATAATQSSTAASTTGGANTLASLSSNFTDFLNMLMTQLQNQDPTSPMDTNQFTSELVQFTSVEQQINTNSSLTKLIQYTQDGTMLQSAQMVGKQVAVTASQLALQNGQAGLQYTATSAGPVVVTVTDSSGNILDQQTAQAAQGPNSWNWNGQTSAGTQLPDGAYNVSVTEGGGALPFAVVGTASGVQNASSGLALQLGALSVPFSSLVSVLN